MEIALLRPVRRAAYCVTFGLVPNMSVHPRHVLLALGTWIAAISMQVEACTAHIKQFERSEVTMRRGQFGSCHAF
jgi:hypothetical protein